MKCMSFRWTVSHSYLFLILFSYARKERTISCWPAGHSSKALLKSTSFIHFLHNMYNVIHFLHVSTLSMFSWSTERGFFYALQVFRVKVLRFQVQLLSELSAVCMQNCKPSDTFAFSYRSYNFLNVLFLNIFKTRHYTILDAIFSMPFMI